MTQWQRNIHLPHSHRSTWLQFHNNPEENTNERITTRPSNWERLRRPWRWPRLAKGRDWGYIGGSVTVACTVVSAAVPPSPRAGQPCHLRYGCARRKVIVCHPRPPFRAIQVPVRILASIQRVMVLSPLFSRWNWAFQATGRSAKGNTRIYRRCSGVADLCEWFYVGLVNFVAGKLSKAREMNSLCAIFPLCN